MHWGTVHISFTGVFPTQPHLRDLYRIGHKLMKDASLTSGLAPILQMRVPTFLNYLVRWPFATATRQRVIGDRGQESRQDRCWKTPI